MSDTTKKAREWLLLDPHLKQNINGFKQEIRIAIHQDTPPGTTMTGETIKVMEVLTPDPKDEQIRILKEALVFYASQENWECFRQSNGDNNDIFDVITGDFTVGKYKNFSGARAREALKKVGGCAENRKLDYQSRKESHCRMERM